MDPVERRGLNQQLPVSKSGIHDFWERGPAINLMIRVQKREKDNQYHPKHF
jgi:hypothetical protein